MLLAYVVFVDATFNGLFDVTTELGSDLFSIIDKIQNCVLIKI